jgi:hypothetical protein
LDGVGLKEVQYGLAIEVGELAGVKVLQVVQYVVDLSLLSLGVKQIINFTFHI